MKIPSLALVGIVASVIGMPVWAQRPPADESRAAQRRIVEPGGFLDRPNPVGARARSCQPSRGDIVKVQRVAQPAPGIDGASVLEIVVTSGRCRGSSGWIGSHHLTPAEFSR
ncbi:MAG: hypothetical protein KIT17_08455 [Rubrivivax sp.]|nr:hypothetical protein [Rubrivivax sp.]